MRRGDFLLTPGWTWHDHALDSDQDEPMIWFDALDVPFVANMQAGVYQKHPSVKFQAVEAPAPERDQFGGVGMLPGRGRRDRPVNSPQCSYRWADSEPVLEAALERGDIDSFEGAVFEYVNPVTGGHVMPTIACFVHGFPTEFRSLARRRTSASLCVVLQGSGATIIDGKRFTWSERDIIAEPAWSWIEYEVSSDAVIFRVTDQPLLEPFGLDRVEDHPDGHQCQA
jgi:gentisate 1,2-dioxygenase